MSKITVSFQPTAAGSHWSGDTAYLRIYYYGSRPEAFSFSTGEMWSPSLETFYREVACTIASNVVTIPTTILDSTPDITNRPDVFVRMVLVDSARSEDGAILLAHGWDIPIALGSSVTFEQLRIHNETPVVRQDDRFGLSRTAIEELIAERDTLLDAVPTSTTAGLIAAGTAGRLRRITDALRGLVLDTGSRWINLLMGNVSIEEFASLAAMITDIGSTERTVFVPASYSVAASATIPANITLKFTGSGKLDVASGQTVTLEGAVSAPARQVFTGSGSVVFTGNRRVSDIDPRWWGATGDGTTDSTAAFQAAAAARNATGGRLLIPPSAGGFLIGGAAVANQILSKTSPGEFAGWGPRSVLLIKSDTPATTDVIRATPPAHVGQQEALLNFPEDNAGYDFRYFVIKAQSGTPARDGIRVDITTPGSFFQNSHIQGLHIGDLGGHSVSLLNTGGVNADGIFNNFIEGNIFHGGVYADALGDSNHINRNRFWSSSDNTHRALDISVISGAGANEFIGNSITMKLGAKVAGGTGTLFLANYGEPFWPGSAGADGAILSIDGGAVSPKVWGNTFNGGLGGNTLNAVHLGNVSGATVDGNYFSVPATKYGVNVSASASDTTVTAAQTVTGGGSLMNDLGSGTNVDVFSSSGGRITRVGTAFGSALGGSSPVTGFAALDAAVLEINRNAATSTDTKFAALLLSAIQSGTSNLLGVIHFLNTSLAGDDDSVAALSGSTDGADNSGRCDLATRNAGGALSVKLGIGKNGVDFLRLSPLTPAQITSNQNNYNPGSAAPVQRWSSDASRNVTGLSVSQAGGVTLRVWNVGSQDIVLVHESASSTAANRFTCSTGADITLGANKCAVLDYDGVALRWRAALLS